MHSVDSVRTINTTYARLFGIIVGLLALCPGSISNLNQFFFNVKGQVHNVCFVLLPLLVVSLNGLRLLIAIARFECATKNEWLNECMHRGHKIPLLYQRIQEGQ